MFQPRIIVLFVVFVCLLSSCGGGGGGGNTPATNYNRTGSKYMPTITGKALTYSVVKTTPWDGFYGGEPNACWEDNDPTTYRRATETIAGTAYQVMKAEPQRDQRESYPVFLGTKFYGNWTEHDWGLWGDKPITILPDTLPNVGVTWDTGASISMADIVDGAIDLGNYIEPIFAITGEILGTETVVTPAGTYTNALKVRYTGEVQMQGPGGMTSLGGASATIWYAENVGPVRAVGTTVLTGEVEVVLSSVAD